ncbi:hypothetical protein BG011_005456 [Mortierella polycephala]|uniref:C3H1-type domain-containing protein n=1 Tax=Mortierella polycephala TaxID=41804 RepID=A0A9P6PY22_9FUNG|nr:hypothetical protein BG011_005456 [Mortierella polycephala]
MRISTAASLVALSTLTILTISPYLNQHGTVSAALTPEERIQVEAKDPGNPNYCPACLKKAMSNHFPHACPKNMDALGASRTEGDVPSPEEERCVCVSFMDLYWMKEDCSKECSFVHDAAAMEHFLPAKSIPGCDAWIDFETNELKEIDGFKNKDPNYKPELFPTEDSETTTTTSEGEQAEEMVETEESKAEDNKAEEPKAEEAETEEPVAPETQADKIPETPKAEKEVKDEL